MANPTDNRGGPQGPYTGTAFITRPDGTNLYFDLTDEERYSGTAEVTEFPVEDGGFIADNVRLKPGTFTMRCTISNTPIVASGNQGGTYPGVSPYDQDTVNVEVKPYVAPFNAVSAILNPVGTIINALSASRDQTYPLTIMFPDDFDGPTDALFILADMQARGDLLEITTSLCLYENYILEHFELVKDGSPRQMVDLAFKQIVIVQTTTSAQPFVSTPNATNPKTKGQKSPPAAAPGPVKSLLTVAGNAAGNANAGTAIVP
jgi:hypothetical protein